jgi:hypothetical protein
LRKINKKEKKKTSSGKKGHAKSEEIEDDKRISFL